MESELWPALDDFEDNVEAVSKTLKPLLEQNLPKHASMLPLFDKAKLYIITTYALESLLYSYLETSATPTANHPIMKELTRVRQYFQKIRDIESKEPKGEEQNPTATPSSARGDTRDSLVLDKAAAGRFISAALAGNDKYDVERAENIRLQKEKAKEKLGELGEGVKDPLGQRALESSSDDDDDDEEDGGVRLVTGDSDNEAEQSASAGVAPKIDGTDDIDDAEKKRRKKEEKKRKRESETKEGSGWEKKSKKRRSKRDRKGKSEKKK